MNDNGERGYTDQSLEKLLDGPAQELYDFLISAGIYEGRAQDGYVLKVTAESGDQTINVMPGKILRAMVADRVSRGFDQEAERNACILAVTMALIVQLVEVAHELDPDAINIIPNPSRN